jgi:hypothetical protein
MEISVDEKYDWVAVWHTKDGRWIKTYNDTEEMANKKWSEIRFHKLDGPFIERSDGKQEWWVDGKKLDCSTQEEFERLMKLRAFW